LADNRHIPVLHKHTALLVINYIYSNFCDGDGGGGGGGGILLGISSPTPCNTS